MHAFRSPNSSNEVPRATKEKYDCNIRWQVKVETYEHAEMVKHTDEDGYYPFGSRRGTTV
jgi:hypothetical protein